MSFADQYKIDLGASNSNFSTKYGTINPVQTETTKPKADAAGIINASANGLDSIAGFVSLFTGNSPVNQQTTNYQEPPPEDKKMNPLVIGGIVGGAAILLILTLILLKNGKPSTT